MKKKIPLSMTIGLIVLTAFLTLNLTFLGATEIFNDRIKNFDILENEYQKFEEVRDYIDTFFVGEYNQNEAMEMALSGYILGMGDQWSHYLNKEQFTKYKEENKGKLVGIGVSVKYNAQNQYIEITDVYKNSPAEKAGIKPFEGITAINGKSVAELGYTEAVNLVRGEVGTTVKVTLLDTDKKTRELEIKRDKFNQVVITSQIIDGNIGYIKISEFLEGSENDFSKKVDTLIKSGSKGIIFDVRFNPGGSVDTVANMLDKLVPEGDIISLKDKAGQGKTIKSSSSEINIPMVVITNEYSVSAAEFFAAIMQEYEKGIIVGEKTLGKGYSQQSIELKDGSGLILSTNTYYTSKGKNLADIGITPDVEVSLTQEQKINFSSLSQNDDAQLQKAIDIIKEKIV